MACRYDPRHHQLSWIVDIDNDEAVNELIDGFDAESRARRHLVAERLDSAGYSMALSIDKKSIEATAELADRADISATEDRLHCFHRLH